MNEHDVTLVADIVYDHENRLSLDLYLPVGVDRPPVVVYLHGGAWLMGHRTDFADRLRGLAAQGVAVASIDYRTVDVAAFPAQQVDIERAIAWLASNAEQYLLAPGAVTLMGSSAGAHLAALTAFRLGGDGSVGALVGLFGRYNLLPDGPAARPGLEVPEVVRSSVPPAGFEGVDPRGRLALLAGTTTAELDTERLTELSPLHHASNRVPPTLLGHGTRDAIVDHRHSLDLAAKLADVGSPREVAVILLPGANHEDDDFADTHFLRVVADFVRRHQA